MLTELIKFIVLRPINVDQISSFSGEIKTYIRMLYVHTGCGKMQKGGLRWLAHALSGLPTKIQPYVIDEIHVIEPKVRLNFRVGKFKLACKLVDALGSLGANFWQVHREIFKKMINHNDL